MGELRAKKRVGSSVQRRGVQGRLAITMHDDAVTGEAYHGDAAGRDEGFRRPAKLSNRVERPQTPAPVFHPLAYRGVVAGWSIESREQWGRRANELEDAGLAWRDAEAQAFVEVWHRVRSLNARAAVEVEDRRA
jgi:hypothetical protein